MIPYLLNHNDFFTANFFNDEDFRKKVLEKAGLNDAEAKAMADRLADFKKGYEGFRKYVLETKDTNKYVVSATHLWHNKVLKMLGYPVDEQPYEFVSIKDNKVVPVRHISRVGSMEHADAKLMVLEIQHMIPLEGESVDGIFNQSYHQDGEEVAERASRYKKINWEKVFTVPEGQEISPKQIDKAISALFLLDEPQRPDYVLLLAGNMLFLMEAESWSRGAYLQLDFELLLNEWAVERTGKKHLHSAMILALFGHDYLVPTAGQSIMGQLNEDNHKSAFAVTEELKAGIIHAIEKLANEAIYYFEHLADEQTREQRLGQLHANANDLRDDCLTMVYRLLFLFYAESRPDLGIAPMNDSVYARGYSLDILRDLELATLNGEQATNGYFFHESLQLLFNLMASGYGSANTEDDYSFALNRLDSPLFDDSKLKVLKDVRVRNVVWQQIIKQLSLAEKQKAKGGSVRTGRISYANLGINQLGAVYESLLAFRGFFADQDYLEVGTVKKKAKDVANEDDEDGEDDGQETKANDSEKPNNDGVTFLVPLARRADFEEAEIRKDETGQDIIIRQGTFVYRLSGRDRQRSASYYTPEVLTKATVKYTLAGFVERLENKTMTAQELLTLKILEPAMGAAAFQNEVINQLAELYLRYRQHERKHRIDPDQYRHELQKVKAYIAMNNVYGVDLNPTAIELGKLSIWLNVIFPGMEAPFFGYRLGVGNAVMGCWNRVYERADVQLVAKGTADEKKKEWWKKAPTTLGWRKVDNAYQPHRKPGQLYHFLLPDENMAAPYKNKELKELANITGNTEKLVKDKLKAFKEPLGIEELNLLERISTSIDQLWAQHYTFQKEVARDTAPRWKVYGQNGGLPTTPEGAALSYQEKEKLSQQREGDSTAYFKLRMVMDYWAALWCWPVDRMDEFPTRQRWHEDLSIILGLQVPTTAKGDTTTQHVKVVQEATLFGAAVVQADLFGSKKTVELGQYRQNDDVAEALEAATRKSRTELFENSRLRTVRELQQQYRFFHYPLEFVEVLAERGGFDVIAGNPPWLKLEFEEKVVMAEQYPELLIRKTSAAETLKKKAAFLEDAHAKAEFLQDQSMYCGSVTFMNAYQNYHLLAKQQTNLYKCILVNLLELTSQKGYAGILHPEGIYDDPKAGVLRAYIYKRLKYHFQFVNVLKLFSEILHWNVYGLNVYSGQVEELPFINSISNVFHPNTIDECFYTQKGLPLSGIKNYNPITGRFTWNITGQPERLVKVGQEELEILARVFEDSQDWQEAKLVSFHGQEMLSVIKQFAAFSGKVVDHENLIRECWHESNDAMSGFITRQTKYPDLSQLEMIYSGPHFYVANPLYKTPQSICKIANTDYDPLDLTTLPEDYVPRTNYVPATDLLNFKAQQKGFETGKDANGKPVYDDWFGYYKLAFRKMLSQAGERTLTGAVIPANASHIGGVISIVFKKDSELLELTSLTSSLPLDFFVKTLGKGNMYEDIIGQFPLGIDPKYHAHMFPRTLALNCLTRHYAALWERNWQPAFSKTEWSLSEGQLHLVSSWAERSATWSASSPLRTYYERRQALVELDVLAAMALGLSLDQLLAMYRIQFPVLQQNEHDTWYDQKGNIVFTCSKGLTGVGLDRPTWNELKARELELGETYVHTISKKQSELYAGTQVTYVAPFFKPDREQDYAVAWGFFEKNL